jgi:predicted GIY-YIG superfamily endonuclease
LFYYHIEEAIVAEKAIKGSSRNSKIALIESINDT